MCGIAGCIGKKITSGVLIEKTLEKMHHRGPNANGFYTGKLRSDNITLLHSRLSILDLDERANQPFCSEDCVLVFNGEIYNFLELRKQLEKLGWSFITESDTEVIIKSYRQWGIIGCLEQFDGMWAFALFDKAKDKLYLVRDRFGEKPLYYTKINGSIFFGSEIKLLSCLSDHKLNVNLKQVQRFLVNGFKSLFKGNETYFDDVTQVPAASYLEFNSSNLIQEHEYWQLKYQPVEMTREEAVNGVREKLLKSLEFRLRADVPLAFCLSGGIDSSSIVAMSSKKFDYDVHSFSIIDKDERYNELDNINATLKSLNCKHELIYTSTDNFVARMKQLIEYHDSPIATISYYIHSFLSEAIHNKGYKVVLSGTGADEIFTGYYDHYNYWLAEMLNDGEFSELITEWKNSYGQYVRNPVLKDPHVFCKDPDTREHIYLNQKYFSSLMCNKDLEVFTEKQYSTNLLRNRMLNELQNEIVPVILQEDDLNSMMWSIENRSPFLDKNLVEFAYSIPNQYLINNGFVKSILRDACSGFVEDKIRLDKCKRGFNASITSLIDLSDQSTKSFLLEQSPIFDVVDKSKFALFLDSDMSSNSFSKFLFSFISSKLFLESSLVR